MEYIKDTIIFDSHSVALSDRKRRLINRLEEIEDDEEEVTLPSKLVEKKSKKEKKNKKDKINEVLKATFGDESSDKPKKDKDEDTDDWESALDIFRLPSSSSRKKKKRSFSLEDLTGKKKKKKKKKKGALKTYKSEFAEELALLKNLQMEQDKFTKSLQRRYDQLENSKSNARGISKYTTDLIISINNARSTSMQVIDKIISTKAKIADLDFKERKEFGKGNDGETDNMSNYASTYLKEVITAGRDNLNVGSYDYVTDGDVDGIFDSIESNLSDEDATYYDPELNKPREAEADKYLKYENMDVKVHVVYKDEAKDDDPDKYEFVAIDKNGDIVEDYPLPTDTSSMGVNLSTKIATDKYGAKYPLIIV